MRWAKLSPLVSVQFLQRRLSLACQGILLLRQIEQLLDIEGYEQGTFQLDDAL